jgi:hypothetical protein
MNQTELENLNLDALIYDLVKGGLPLGGLNNAQVYAGVHNAIGKEVPIQHIDYTINWLRHEGMIRPDRDKWTHIDFESSFSLESPNEAE